MNSLNGDRYMGKKEINLRDYFYLVRRRFWIIALITIITTAAGYVYNNLNNTLLYQSSTRVIIGSDKANMQTLMVMIKDPIVMEAVGEKLNLMMSPEVIANQVTVERIDESQVIKISAIDSDPKIAVAIANGTAEAFKREAESILHFKDIQLLSAAKENDRPINEPQNRIVVVAFVFGLFTGIGFIFLLDSLDGTVRKDQEVESYLGVPVLGVISNMDRRKVVARRKGGRELEIGRETLGSE